MIMDLNSQALDADLGKWLLQQGRADLVARLRQHLYRYGIFLLERHFVLYKATGNIAHVRRAHILAGDFRLPEPAWVRDALSREFMDIERRTNSADPSGRRRRGGYIRADTDWRHLEIADEVDTRRRWHKLFEQPRSLRGGIYEDVALMLRPAGLTLDALEYREPPTATVEKAYYRFRQLARPDRELLLEWIPDVVALHLDLEVVRRSDADDEQRAEELQTLSVLLDLRSRGRC
jgi:hypothetical protein